MAKAKQQSNMTWTSKHHPTPPNVRARSLEAVSAHRKKDTRKLLKRIIVEGSGHTAVKLRNGHIRVLHSDGTRMITTASTPSKNDLGPVKRDLINKGFMTREGVIL